VDLTEHICSVYHETDSGGRRKDCTWIKVLINGAGATFAELGEVLKVSKDTAKRHVAKLGERAQAVPMGPRREFRVHLVDEAEDDRSTAPHQIDAALLSTEDEPPHSDAHDAAKLDFGGARRRWFRRARRLRRLAERLQRERQPAMEVTLAVRPVVGAVPVGIDGDRDVQRPELMDEGCALGRNVSLD